MKVCNLLYKSHAQNLKWFIFENKTLSTYFIVYGVRVNSVRLFLLLHNQSRTSWYSILNLKQKKKLWTISNALADLGGAPGVRPPKGPNSFVLTYKFYET